MRLVTKASNSASEMARWFEDEAAEVPFAEKDFNMEGFSGFSGIEVTSCCIDCVEWDVKSDEAESKSCDCVSMEEVEGALDSGPHI